MMGGGGNGWQVVALLGLSLGPVMAVFSLSINLVQGGDVITGMQEALRILVFFILMGSVLALPVKFQPQSGADTARDTEKEWDRVDFKDQAEGEAGE